MTNEQAVQFVAFHLSPQPASVTSIKRKNEPQVEIPKKKGRKPGRKIRRQ